MNAAESLCLARISIHLNIHPKVSDTDGQSKTAPDKESDLIQ
jgi:hypothetical protein